MSNTISFDAYDEYLAKKKGATRVDTTRDYDLSTAGENILKGLIPGNTTSFVKGIEKATGKDLSGLRKAAAVADFVPAKLDAGFLGAAEGITDFLVGGAAQIVGQKDAAKWIYEHSWSRDLSGSDVVDAEIGSESKGYQLASDLISGVGNVGFQVAVGTLIGSALAAPVASGAISQAGARAISFAPLFVSASGAGTAENIAKTGELGWRENVGGLLKGGVEVLTEVISPTGKIVDRAINGKSAGSIFRYLSKHAVAKNIIVDFASEAGEEMASYAGGWFIENKLKISDEAFSARDMVYQGVLGGITGAIFAAPSDISLVRSARSSGAKVYAQGDAAVKNKINEGLIEVKLLKERGLNNDNVKLAEAALAKLTTDENLPQTTKEYYLGLAEQMVLKQNLSDQYNALAKELVAKAKADPATAQSMADAFNAIVNEAGGEGKYTAADFTNENSEAARIYVVAQMANDWLSRSDAEIATDEIMKRKAALYQGTAEQKNAIRSMQDGSTVAFRVGDNAYAVVTKRAGTDTYSVGFTTPGQVERDGAVYATHKLSADKVEELLAKPMTEQQIDAGIVENLAKKAQAEVEKEQKAEKKQAKAETKKKPAAKTEAKTEEAAKKKAETESKGKKKTPVQAKNAGEKASLSPATTESAQTEQTTEQTTEQNTQQAQSETKKVAPEDLSSVEKRLTSAFGIDGSEFTKEEWTKARECVPNIDGLTRREQARVLTLVRTAQANGINEDYMKGLARLSSVYGFGVVFEDIDVAGFYSRKNGMVVINPKNLDETYGHEIEHSFDQIVKEGKAEFRTDLSEKVKRIVGASVFDRAKAQYKADYEKLRARDGSVAELSDAELDAEAAANVVGKYLSNMTLLKKIAATDYSLGRGLLAAIRRMKDKWTSAKAFAKENDSTAFAEYRKMTRIERMLMQELSKRQVEIKGLSEEEERRRRTEDHTQTVVQIWNEEQERIEQQEQEETEPFTQDPTPVTSETTTEEPTTTEAQTTEELETAEAPESTEETQTEETQEGTTAETSDTTEQAQSETVDTTEETPQETAEATEQTEAPEQPKKRSPRKKGASSATVTNGAEVTSSTARIEDFGEKIGGARKDEWSKRGLQTSDLADMNEDEKNKYCKKDFIWKRPDYVKLVEAGGDRVLLYAYNELRKSLQSAVSFSRYANEETREASRSLYIETIRQVEAKLDTCTEKEDFDNLLNWLESEGYLERYTGGWGYHLKQKYYDNPAFVSVGNYKSKNTFAYKVAEIVYHFDNLKLYADRAGFVTDVKNKLPPGFRVHKMTDGTFAIVKGRYIIERGFATYDEAVKKILDSAKERKTKTRFVPVQLLEIHRKGYNYRSGKNVGGQDYLDTFGFRGGEFGNWMSEKDRQVSLNYGYDALMDLADALGIDTKGIALDGKLSIAFGSRGVSRALAHYEPLRRVINLTKMRGAGSLAHEWFHALDHHLTTADGKATPQKTIAELRAESYRQLGNKLEFATGTEQGFIQGENDGKYYASVYSSIMDEDTKNALLSGKQGAYALNKNAGKFVFVPIEDGFTLEDYKSVKSGSGSAIETRDSANDEVRTAMMKLEKAMTRTESGSDTQFLKDARRLEGSYSRDGGYWTSKNEMAARAFSTYVLDKIKAKDFRDDYLVGHAEAVATLADSEGNVAYGYPRGEDRVRINEAFDNLFRVIKEQGILKEQAQAAKPELVSYSPATVTPETDSRYLSLARDPQKNESELRRLVKEAAEKAGFDSPLLYHGTGNFGFTKFDLSKMDDRRTIFLTDSEEIASTYSGSKGIRGVSGKATIPNNVDAVYFATELNNNLPAQEQDNGYYYTAYSRKALSNLEKQNRIDLAKLKLFLKEKGYEYGEESSWSHKFAATIGQLTVELNKPYNSKKNNLSTPIYILANNTDLFGGLDVEINGNYGLESRIRLAMRLSEFFSNNAETNTVKDSVVAKVGMDGYDVEVYSYDDARALLEENSGRGNYGLYANLDNTIEINGDGRNWNALLYQADVSRFYEPIQGAHGYRIYNTFTNETFYLADTESGEFATKEEAQKRIDGMVNGYKYRIARLKTTREVSRWAQAMGYSGVVLRNITDNGGQNISVKMGEKANIFMFFDPASLKSADPVTYDDNGNIIPLSERFNPQNDDIRYSPASYGGKSGRYVAQSQPARQTIREKITNKAGQLNRQGFRNALKEGGSILEGFKIGFVNAQQAVENQLVSAGMTKREAAAVIQYARTGRSHAFNAAQYKLADMTGEIRSEGLLKIIEPFLATKGEVYDAVDPKTGEKVQSTAKGGEMGGRKYIDFGDYYSMLHAIDREAAGNNPYSDMTVADMKRIVAEYEKENPDFKAAAEKLSAFNSALLDIEVQAGIRSQENADNLRKKYPHYIPMYVQEDGEIGRAPVRGARNMEVRRDNKAATESNHRVNDAIKNYLNQVERRIRAAKFNLVLQEVYNSADEVNVVKAEDAKATARDLREREKAYLENPETETDPAEMFRKVQKGRQTVNEVSFYMDGKRVTMAVTDRIYTGLSDLAGIHSSILDLGLVKFTAKINSTFKKLVTNWNPFFAVKNIARDLQDGMLQSRFGMGEFLNMYRKNAEMMMSGKYNKEWELFLANGCLEASIFSDEFGTVAKSGKSGLEQAVGVAGQFQHIKNFNTLTEALPRFTEFCLTLKHGGTVQQAIYNAADVTVNFGRSGTLIRILNSTVSPFLNPAVQGLDRVIRLFTEDGIKNNKALASLLLKAVLLAIIPMALGNAMYGDDDEYKNMQDNIKENNYLFKVGDTWLKLPRGRVVSTISGLFNRSYKQLTGQETDWGDYGKNVLDQITPAQNVARHIGSPFMDVANNRTWYGTKIESDALQNYAVNQRYDENTSRISVWIGQLTSHFGLSPKEVNYLIDQYTGVVGDILLPTTTPAGTKGVVSYNFTVDPNTSSNLSNRFYDLYNKTMYKSNGGDVEAYYLKKRLDETKSAVSELFKQIKTINASSELSNKEKVKQASAIRASINQLYKTAIDDRRLYEQNIKDALAIENSYAVEKITAQSAKRYGLDSDAVGKYALTFGGDFAKQFNTEAQANDYKADASKKTVYAEANRLTYGAEYALREYNSNVYDKAKTLNELGISYDEYYNYYMTARYYSGKTKKDKILAYLNGSGLSKSQIALMMYYSGYSAYADEAKKAIKASSLSAERKKELLAGITD